MEMEKDVKDLTATELTNPNFIKSIFDNYDNERERSNVLSEILSVAKEQRVLSKVKKEIDKCNKEVTISTNDVYTCLLFNNSGKPEPTVDNYISVMEQDETITHAFAYDEFSNNYVCYDNGKTRLWNDTDDSGLRAYIEQKYGIYNQQKYFDAFNTVAKRRGFHPIKDIIEAEEWDGVPRIDRFLVDIVKCEDNDYYREVSRMIFYGGISRLYNPGCKFDYMPILIGPQGSMKTSIVSWLALDDKYYTDVSSIEGKDAMEIIQGRWICEFAELLAMVRTKDVEAMKSFITRGTDKYRRSYDRRTGIYPRQCIFIGTTNDYQFLSDKTGNRRYLPVKIGLKTGGLMNKEKKTKEYILNCWREALVLYKKGETYLTIPSKYYNLVVEEQASVLEDDPKTGLLMQYLDSKKPGDTVCALEIFTKCFNGIKKNYSRAEGKEINRFMTYQNDWERGEGTLRFDDFGVQRYWKKLEPRHDWDDLD